MREAVVNAVAHRDYAKNGNVQVMLFSDRLQWLSSRRVENEVIERALFNFRKAAATGGSKPLYDANCEVTAASATE